MGGDSSDFTISAGPSTDLWRKPPSTDVSNAPTRLGQGFPLSQFRCARVTVSASWKQRYDQGGLLLMLTRGEQTKWLKTGIEFYNNAAQLSTVGCDAWADWSIYPLSTTQATIEVAREFDDNGVALWIYEIVLDDDGKVKERKPVREVTWMFAEQDGWEVQVGAYAARPAKEEDVDRETLEVSFRGLVVDPS